MTISPDPATACPSCGTSSGRELQRFTGLVRVTSDCRPWPAGGRLWACRSCGLAYKPADAAFTADIARIYAGYRIYHQSGGAEQRSFDVASGLQEARSARLMARLVRELDLPETGRLLDVGCGNGATLRAFGRLRPRWSLVGTELDDRHRGEIEAIPGATFRTGSIPDDLGSFDLVSLVHVLEHVIDTVGFLRSLAGLIGPHGRLFVEVPHHPDNPFELLIADHRSHFTATTLAATLAAAGFAVDDVSNTWIARELSAVARPTAPAAASPAADPDRAMEVVERSLDWLVDARGALLDLASAGRPLGLFGTAIAGTWLAGSAGDAVTFFVDEDPDRIGRSHLGRPILAPTAIPPHAIVFVGLPPATAAAVIGRLAPSGATWIAPRP